MTTDKQMTLSIFKPGAIVFTYEEGRVIKFTVEKVLIETSTKEKIKYQYNSLGKDKYTFARCVYGNEQEAREALVDDVKSMYISDSSKQT